MGNGSIDKDKVKLRLEAIGEEKEPVQMQLSFARPYSDIALKEAIRGVTAIAKELIRFGFDDRVTCTIMDMIASGKPIVAAAIDAMDEKILAAQDD